MLDSDTEAALQSARDEIARTYGDQLVCIALFGSAASGDFVPGHSDLNLAIVLRKVGMEQLQALHRQVPNWRKRHFATPILLDAAFLRGAVDVFPIEFQDIAVRHRILHGEDVFADIAIDPKQLRFQIEQEARGKLLRLRLAFVESTGSDEQIEALMLRSVKSFVSIVRSLIRWRSPGAAMGDHQMLERFALDFGFDLPNIARILRVRSRQEKWWTNRTKIFAGYLAEVEKLVDLVDRLDPEA